VYSINNYYYGDTNGTAYYDKQAADEYLSENYAQPSLESQQVPSDSQALLDGAEEDLTEVDQAEQEKLQQLMMKGVNQFADGNYEAAKQLFQQVMVQQPGNVDSILAYAVSQFALGNYYRAAEAIRRGVKIDSQVVNVPFDIRDRYGEVEDFRKHLEELEAYVREKPESEDAWLVLGFVRHFTFERELANSTFEILKRRSERDRAVANAFLDAKPLEEILQAPSGEAATQTAPSGATGANSNPYGVEQIEPGQYRQDQQQPLGADLDSILAESEDRAK
jgi:tetratricopeptide (TPR) repeat protein